MQFARVFRFCNPCDIADLASLTAFIFWVLLIQILSHFSQVLLMCIYFPFLFLLKSLRIYFLGFNLALEILLHDMNPCTILC